MIKTSLYTKLSNLTNDYLSSDSHGFLDDLIEFHLKIDSERLNLAGLRDVLIWLEITASLIVEDQKRVQQYLKKVRQLTEPK